MLGKTRPPSGFWWNGRIPAMLHDIDRGLGSMIDQKQGAGVLVPVLSKLSPDNQTIRLHPNNSSAQ